MKRRALTLTALTAALLGTAVGPATAAWNSSGTGVGAARAGQLQPPVAPRVAVTSAGAHLSWTAPTTGAMPGGYVVTRNGATVCTTTGTACDDSNLAPATTYTYLVASTAGARWVSATPVTLTATTLAGAFAFSAVSPSPVPAGSTMTFTLAATFGNGITDSRYTGAHTLTITSSASASPGGGAVSATFVAGMASKIAITVYGSGPQTLTVSDGSRTGSLAITVSPS